MRRVAGEVRPGAFAREVRYTCCGSARFHPQNLWIRMWIEWPPLAERPTAIVPCLVVPNLYANMTFASKQGVRLTSSLVGDFSANVDKLLEVLCTT